MHLDLEFFGCFKIKADNATKNFFKHIEWIMFGNIQPYLNIFWFIARIFINKKKETKKSVMYVFQNAIFFEYYNGYW